MSVLDQEQLLTGQVITAPPLATAQRVVAAPRYDDRIFRDFHRLDIAKFVRNGHQQNVELSSGKLVQQNWSRSLPHIQLELRQRSAQMLQQGGQDIGPDCGDYPEPERPGQWLLRVAGQPDQFLGVDQQALGARRDLFPQGCQHHAAMVALKQRYAQPCLELLDPVDQRVRHEEPTCRSTAEMALLGQSTEKTELLNCGPASKRSRRWRRTCRCIGPAARNGGPST